MTEPRILPMKIRQIPIDDIETHPDNARIGDVAAISGSLEANGQYRPLVVQKSTGYILCGNHTWQAAKNLGWKHVAVQYVDAGSTLAKRILLADNRTADTAEYDHEALAGLLSELGEITGTGFTDEEFEVIVGSLEPLADDPEPLDALTGPETDPEPGHGQAEPEREPVPMIPAQPEPAPPPAPVPAPRPPTADAPDPPVVREITMGFGYPPDDHREAVTLISEIRKVSEGEPSGSEVVLRALRTLMAALDARHDPDATISVARLLRNAD